VLSKNLHVRFKAGDLWVGKQGRLELHYDQLRKRWYGRIPVKVQWPRRKASKPHHSTRKRASIDLGICNLATCVIERQSLRVLWPRRTQRLAVLDETDRCSGKRVEDDEWARQFEASQLPLSNTKATS
jgi:transposase